MSEQRKFQPFDRVLVRDDDGCTWEASLYSHLKGDRHIVAGGGWSQCIPYEDNKHLVGTNQAPDEPFEFGEHVEVSEDGTLWAKAVYLWRNEKSHRHMCGTEFEARAWKRCRKADW